MVSHPVDTNATDWHHLTLIIQQCDDYFATRHFEVQFDLELGISGLVFPTPSEVIFVAVGTVIPAFIISTVRTGTKV